MADTQVQPKIVQVPSIGNIQFPGDMPDDQISAAIQKNYPQLAAPKPAPNPYQQVADKVPGGTGTSMSAGTQTFDQAHPKPEAGAVQRFAQGAGIPTSQSETAEAVRGMLNPQADPNETDSLLRKEEQIPVLGGDFRARAALAKRAANETGAVSVAHKVAALVPLVGPAVAAAQDEYDKGNYAGAAGAGLNALLSMEGARAGLEPKAPELPVKSLSAETTEAAARPPVNPVTPAPGVATRSLSTILGGGEKAMAKRPLKGATAAGSASNTEVAQYAKDNGIDLLPGQATGAKGLQTIQAVGERTIVAPGDLPERLDQQKAAFGNLVDNFKQRVGTEAIPDTEAAGTSLKSQAQHGLDNLKQSAQQDYQAFEQQAGDIPVDLSDVKAKAAATLASQAEALKNVPAQYANPVRNVLKKLSDLQAGPEADPATLKSFNDAVETYGLNAEQQANLRTKLGLPDENGNSAVKMSTAQQLRSAYLDISRDYTGNVPKSVQRYAAQAAKDIDAAMTKAADSAGATDQWRQANAKWKQLQQTYNNPEHPLYKVLQESDPSKVPSRLLGKGNYGGSPQTVRQLQQAGIDISPLKREVAQQIADRNFALTNGGRGLAGYSTEFLKTLFNPAEFDELTKMGRVGRAIKFEMNPSGTSNVGEGGHQLRAMMRHAGPIALGGGAGFALGGPAGAVIGATMAGAGDAMIPSIAARLSTSKRFARATMGDIAPQPRALADILGSRGPEPPPETPPTGAAPVTPPSGPVAPVAPKASGMAAQPRSLSDILSSRPAAPISDKIGGAKVLKGDVRLTGPVAPRPAEVSRLQAELKAATDPKERADIQQAIDYLTAGIEEKPFNLPEQAKTESLPTSQPREFDPGTYNRETKVHTPGKPQSTVQVPMMITRQMEADLRSRGISQTEIDRMTPAQAQAKLKQPQSVTSAVHDVLGELPNAEHKPTTPQQRMEAGKTVAGNYGNDTAVKTTTGSLPAKYKVVEADSLIPSHNAQTFAKNPQYPEGVQERDYARSKEAQSRVIQQAQNYDPAYTVNTNPDAVNGPPVVTKDGIVLGGNSRTMSTQRLYKAGAGDVYKNSLRMNASQFGVTPAAIDSMRNPVLVREVETPANIEQARRIGADLNKNMTGAMGVGEKAVSAGRSVKPQTLATISGMVNDMGEGATLRDVMRQNGKDIVSMMVKDGVISDRERPQFIDTSTGGLNDEGKSFVERALMGSVVDDPRLMDRVPKSVLGKLEGSLGDLASIGARSDEYNLMPLVREALQEHAEMAMRGLDVNKYLAQGSMFGQAGNPAVEAMTRALAEKPKAFREALSQYAQDAKFDSQGQGLLGIMGKKPSAVQAFNDAFGSKLTEEQFHDALLQSTEKEGTINPNGYPDQAAGSNEGVRQASARNAGAGSAGKGSATQAGGKAADQPQAVAQRSLSDILSGKPQEKIDLNAPKSKRKIPPDVTAKADYSGQTVPAKAPTFFSKAEQVAEEKLPNTVKADQVVSTLQNAGVKADEMKWLGLDDYLKGKDKVSKADLLDHIRQNNVQVKEVLRGAQTSDAVAAEAKANKTAVKLHDLLSEDFQKRGIDAEAADRFAAELVAKIKRRNKSSEEILYQEYRNAPDKEPPLPIRYAARDLFNYLGDVKQAERPPKFSNYQLPGGENYRELLLQLPEKEQTLTPRQQARLETIQSIIDNSPIGDRALSAAQHREYALLGEGRFAQAQKQFKSGHFDEPNVLAHVRFNDRISPDGKKTLFLEELQSDWHQKGRKEGYQVSPQQRTEMDARRQEIENLGKQATPEQRQEWTDIMNELHRSPNKVPDAPFKTTWHELAMKRMLRYAAENGYDQLAWTTGEQQAARYDLSKQLDAVRATKTMQGHYAIKATDKTGHVVMDDVFDASKLPDVVGKELAQKIVDEVGGEPTENQSHNKTYSGLDLKVGGSGMKGFYDKILPDFMNKYGKKWGAKVGETQIGGGDIKGDTRVIEVNEAESVRPFLAQRRESGVWKDIGSFDTKAQADAATKGEGQPVHSIPITPSMRKDVIFKGQPIAKKEEPRSLVQMLSGSNA